MICYSCPRCRAFLTVEDTEAGNRHSCPTCGQRLQVPLPPADRTVLGRLEASESTPYLPSPSRPVVVELAEEDELRHRPSRRGRPSRRRRSFHCPFCDSPEPPFLRQQISETGWVVFAVLLVVFLPLCFIGLLIQENYEFCGDCGAKLGRPRQPSLSRALQGNSYG